MIFEKEKEENQNAGPRLCDRKYLSIQYSVTPEKCDESLKGEKITLKTKRVNNCLTYIDWFHQRNERCMRSHWC